MENSAYLAANPDHVGGTPADPAAGVRDDAMRALIDSLAGSSPTVATWCPGWSTHEIAAHVAAASQERAAIVEAHVPGRPDRPTRGWAEREAPFRRLPHTELVHRLSVEAARFEHAVRRLDTRDTVTYTGWNMTAGQLSAHARSEAALHRWDVAGDDATSVRLLSEPATTEHALAVFAHLPSLAEARYWSTTPFTGPLRLRAAGHPDVLVRPGEAPAINDINDTEDTHDTVIELEAHERLLVLWGRCPAALRSPEGNAETVHDVLRRLGAVRT